MTKLGTLFSESFFHYSFWKVFSFSEPSDFLRDLCSWNLFRYYQKDLSLDLIEHKAIQSNRQVLSSYYIQRSIKSGQLTLSGLFLLYHTSRGKKREAHRGKIFMTLSFPPLVFEHHNSSKRHSDKKSSIWNNQENDHFNRHSALSGGQTF